MSECYRRAHVHTLRTAALCGHTQQISARKFSLFFHSCPVQSVEYILLNDASGNHKGAGCCSAAIKI